MERMQRFHPLDRLISDDSLFMLEAMIPFVDNNTKRILVIIIKYKEITSIMNALDNHEYLCQCGFDCHPKTTDDFIKDLGSFMPESYRQNINNMMQMMNMMKMMDMMDTTSKNSSPNVCEQSKGCNTSSSGSYANNSSSLYDSILSILDNK